jgi:hypothetical protein
VDGGEVAQASTPRSRDWRRKRESCGTRGSCDDDFWRQVLELSERSINQSIHPHQIAHLDFATFTERSVAFAPAAFFISLTTTHHATMAATLNMEAMDEVSDFQLPPRKKPKTSDLPLSSAQRSSIEGMLHTFKKKGDFDSLRKKAFQQYNESAQRGMFEASLRAFTGAEIEREPFKYLRPDRRLAAPLLEGAAARAEVYEKSQADVDNYIEQFLANAEETLRDIRRKEIGKAAAADEQARGVKSEEAYAAEAEVRRKERAKKYEEEEKLRKKKEASERKKKEYDALKKKQEELMKETARLQLEQKRRQEREEWKKAEKEREKERIAKFNEEREKVKKEAEEREKVAQAEREKRLRAERELARERDKERLEQEALELLLREGRAMTDRARRPELERSESMEPPPRLRHMAPNTNLSKEEMRSRGLMPTSLTLRKGESTASIPTGPRGDRAVDERTRAADDDIRKRNSRLRSPSPTRRSSAAYPSDHRRREDSRDRGDYYRESARRDRERERDSYYRSSDRERIKAEPRPYDSDSRTRRGSEAPPPPPPPAPRLKEEPRIKEEEGEVVEREAQTQTRASARPRSRSRESHRRRESPPRRSYRERTRSARRSSYRDAPPRRDRSRSPAGIDRYVPGGGTAGGSARRDRSRERDRYREERRDADRYVPKSTRERSRSRRRERD